MDFVISVKNLENSYSAGLVLRCLLLNKDLGIIYAISDKKCIHIMYAYVDL